MSAAGDRKNDKGGLKKSAKAADEPVAAYDNPLVPNVLLKEMYQKMVELQILDNLNSKDSRQGQEAVRVSVTRGFGSADLLLDSQPGPLSAYLLGSKLKDVLPQLIQSKKAPEKIVNANSQLLPYVEDAEARLFAGLGAALTIKRLKRTDVVVILCEAEESPHGAWKRAMRVASAHDLPVIFVVLPELKNQEKTTVSAIADKCGVSAIAVEATDAVALYRVIQESMLRARGAGGPAVIECIGFRAKGKKKAHDVEPVKHLREYLLGRQVGTVEWVDSVAVVFKNQLAEARYGSGMEV